MDPGLAKWTFTVIPGQYLFYTDGALDNYFYFYLDDVVALWESIKAQGYAVSDLRVAFYGMKEFDMSDPSGHVLWFGQETDEDRTVLE